MNLNTGGWASPLLRLVARLRSEGVNSTTPVTEINGGTISAANADIALVAKGTGATLAQVPDGTIAGGNKRGQYATDWQKERHIPGAIASGNYSTIGGGGLNTSSGTYGTVAGGYGSIASSIYATVGGGQSNSASGSSAVVAGGNSNSATNSSATVCGGQINNATATFSFIGGGGSNTASSSYSFVGGGQSNNAQTNTHATVCGGSGNTASGQYAFVGGGQNLSATATNSTVCGGQNNTSSGAYAFVGGGQVNFTSAAYSFISGGRRGNGRSITGYHVFPACSIPVADASGVSQSALLLLGRQTTDATATVLASDASAAGTTNQVILPNNAAYSFSGEVIAGVTAAGDTARWTINGAIKRGANAASTAMVGTPTVTMTHFDAGAATWVAAVTADTTNGGIAVTVTGAAATTIRWVCKINTTEMTY